MSKSDELQFISHIQKELEFISNAMKDVSFEAFNNDEVLKRAVVRALEIVGDEKFNARF